MTASAALAAPASVLPEPGAGGTRQLTAIADVVAAQASRWRIADSGRIEGPGDGQPAIINQGTAGCPVESSGAGSVRGIA